MRHPGQALPARTSTACSILDVPIPHRDPLPNGRGARSRTAAGVRARSGWATDAARGGGRDKARPLRSAASPSPPAQARGAGLLLRAALLLLALLLPTLPARAGQLDRAGVERHFPPPLVVGEKDDRLPVWPILKQQAGSYEVFAYAFESVDLAPIPGFGGTPPDLLIALAPDGTFRDVTVLSHHEPVFLEGLGPEPLLAFVEQYAGL